MYGIACARAHEWAFAWRVRMRARDGCVCSLVHGYVHVLVRACVHSICVCICAHALAHIWVCAPAYACVRVYRIVCMHGRERLSYTHVVRLGVPVCTCACMYVVSVRSCMCWHARALALM